MAKNKDWVKNQIEIVKTITGGWLEVTLLLTIAGSTPVIHQAMLASGIPDSIWLWIAILAIDLIIVGAGSWGWVGAVIAAILCAFNIGIALGPLKPYAPALFSTAAFLGTLGNLSRKAIRVQKISRLHKQETGNDLVLLPSGQLDPSHYKGWSVERLRMSLGLSHGRAKLLQSILENGRTVDVPWLKQKPQTGRPPAKSPAP